MEEPDAAAEEGTFSCFTPAAPGSANPGPFTFGFDGVTFTAAGGDGGAISLIPGVVGIVTLPEGMTDSPSASASSSNKGSYGDGAWDMVMSASASLASAISAGGLAFGVVALFPSSILFSPLPVLALLKLGPAVTAKSMPFARDSPSSSTRLASGDGVGVGGAYGRRDIEDICAPCVG